MGLRGRHSLRRSEHTHMSATQPIIERDLPTRSVWFGAAAAAAAFSVDGLVNWVISWRTCYIGHGEFMGLHLGAVRWLLAAITLGFLCVAIAGGVTAFRNWKAIASEQDQHYRDAHGTVAFLSLLGVFLSVTLGMGIIWLGIPLIFLDICMRAN
jgi:hypothetical protein